jgi:hypothetical protein
MTTTTPRILPLSVLRAWDACLLARQTVRRLYPDGVPLTVAAAQDLHEHGVDVWWGVARLLSAPLRAELVRYILAETRPALARLLRYHGWATAADALDAMALDTRDGIRETLPAFARAWSAVVTDVTHDGAVVARWMDEWVFLVRDLTDGTPVETGTVLSATSLYFRVLDQRHEQGFVRLMRWVAERLGLAQEVAS